MQADQLTTRPPTTEERQHLEAPARGGHCPTFDALSQLGTGTIKTLFSLKTLALTCLSVC